MIDWVPTPSLLTARNLPSGLRAPPKGRSPSEVCVPAGLADQASGGMLGPLPGFGPAGVPGGLGAGAVPVVGAGGVKVTLALPSASAVLPSWSVIVTLMVYEVVVWPT